MKNSFNSPEHYKIKINFKDYTLYKYQKESSFYSVYRNERWLGTLLPQPGGDTWSLVSPKEEILGLVVYKTTVNYAPVNYGDSLLKACDYLYSHYFKNLGGDNNKT